MDRSFFWSYLDQSPMWRVAVPVFFVGPMVLGYLFPLHRLLIAGIGGAVPVGILVGNYICWRTFGHRVTTAEEREAASPGERAGLAWSFWTRIVGGPGA